MAAGLPALCSQYQESNRFWTSRVKDLLGVSITSVRYSIVSVRERSCLQILLHTHFIGFWADFTNGQSWLLQSGTADRLGAQPPLPSSLPLLNNWRTRTPLSKYRPVSHLSLKKGETDISLGKNAKKKYDPHMWRNIPGVISRLMPFMSASACCLFLVPACTCLPDTSLSVCNITVCSVQSPVYKVSKYLLKTNKA